jgi:hypothetical protein
VRFGEVFRYELGYRVRSASTWLYAGFIFLIAFWVVHVSSDATDVQWTNAPLRLAEMSTLFCGLFGLLAMAGLFSDAVLRDRSARMEPLLFTTRLRPVEHLGGRYLATLLVFGILAFATPLGLVLAAIMPWQPPEAFGPNHTLAYLQPMLLFVLPNALLMSAILFAIAALTRRVIPVYVGAIFIFVGYIVAASYWGGITNPVLSVLADPLGINALKGMTNYWTALERNIRFVGFPPMLLWNRLLWLAISATILGVLPRLFRFTERNERIRDAVSVDKPAEARWDGAVPSTKGVFDLRTRVRQTFAIARQSVAEVMSGWTFQVGFLVTIGLVLLWGWNVGDTVYETITWPVTHLVAGIVLAQRASIIPWLVIAVYAGELVWKDRDTGTSEIGDAVPVRTGVALLGRFLALIAIIVFFQLGMMAGGILLQALHGYYHFELGLYLRILFGWNFIGFVLLAALAMTIHVLVNHKYVGHVVTLMVIVFNVSAQFGVHHLLVYNSSPPLNYSEMNGFGPDVAKFVWFKLYWSAWAALLGLVAMLFWVRGPEIGLRQRLATARARFTRRTAALTAAIVALIAAFGGFIFYNTNILHEYVPRHLEGGKSAEYERRYGKYRNLPQPTITAAELRFEIYPEKHALDARGSYALVNRTGVPIPTIHIETPNGRHYLVRSMTFDRASKPEIVDPEHSYRTFALERPLQPGETLRFTFDVAIHPRGFAHYDNTSGVFRNGSYFDRRLLPFVGYQPAFEVVDSAARKRFGLPPKSMPEPSDAVAARRNGPVFNDPDSLFVETVVGTPADQTVVVPGVLRRTWMENGRRYFHYGSRIPETFGTAVFSAKYAVSSSQWKAPSASSGQSISLQVLHHPPHRASVDRMLATMKTSLDFYTTRFGPIPYRELRIVEVPPYSIHGRAFPSAIAFAEANFITRNDGKTVDLTSFGTAHEIAHQWWGGQVRPAYVKGRSFVNEGLSNYSAMLAIEHTLGVAEARRVYDYQMNRYLSKRGETGRDVPLLEVDEAPHIAYGKGAIALYTLRENIGDEAMNLALRRFLAKFGRTGPPYATSLDLYAELRAVTPPAHYELLKDWFETITLWDLKTQHATSRKLPDGRYEVTLDVLAQKLRATEAGIESPTPMNDLVEVAVYANEGDKPLYLDRHRILSGKQTIRVMVPKEPGRAGVDADGKLIERVREDNVIAVRSE